MSMSLSERLLALHAVFPFSTLRADELLTIATATAAHQFPPGHLLCEQGGMLQRLYIRISGSAVDPSGAAMQPVLGTTILLTGKPAPFAIKAGAQGYRALSIPRGKFFTVIVECPTLLNGFFQMPLLGVDFPGGAL